MDEQIDRSYGIALDTAERLLGFRLEPFLEPGPGEPANGADFTRLATLHAFGDAWQREGVLDLHTRALVSGDDRGNVGNAGAPARPATHRSEQRGDASRPVGGAIVNRPMDDRDEIAGGRF